MKNPVDAALIEEGLNWRYAVKSFDQNKKLSSEQWAVLEKSLLLAPTSYGLQPIKFLVITDQKLKEELVPCAFGQQQLADCSHLVIILAKKTLNAADVSRYIDRIINVRETPRHLLGDYEKTMVQFAESASAEGSVLDWAKRQTYIALGFLMETAALTGIDTCPMEGFSAVEADRILDLTESDYTASVLCPLGFRSENDWLAKLAKVRFPKEELFIKR